MALAGPLGLAGNFGSFFLGALGFGAGSASRVTTARTTTTFALATAGPVRLQSTIRAGDIYQTGELYRQRIAR